MATELTPGSFKLFTVELNAQMIGRARSALTELALVVEKQAKINASSGAHKYGTKTPAIAGTGPAVISGTLRRAITHTPVVGSGTGMYCLVGMGTGFYPPYGGKSRRTPASAYAKYLETGLRNGTTYPFLMPAFRFATGYPANIVYSKAFGTGWKTIL